MHGDDESAPQIVRGSITDRPWGLTLGMLGAAGRTARLTLRSDEKVFRIELDRGMVIAASSPVPADSAVRVALTSHLITPPQVNDLKRRIAAAPAADEVDVLAAAARLLPEQARALRQRLVTQRAARTFSVERGAYELEERAPRPVAEAGIDLRLVVFTGARMNLSELRLALDLRQFGTRFALRPGALEELPRYGFTRVERPVIEALRRGTSLPELEANQRELDPRVAQSVIYALASCDALVQLEPLAAPGAGPAPIPSRTLTPRAPSPTLRAPSPTLRSASPRLRAASPTIRESSPTIRESSPTIRESSPTICESSPTIRESSPRIRESSPTIRESSPRIRASSPTIRASSPTLRPRTPQPRASSPMPREPTAIGGRVVRAPASPPQPPQQQAAAPPPRSMPRAPSPQPRATPPPLPPPRIVPRAPSPQPRSAAAPPPIPPRPPVLPVRTRTEEDLPPPRSMLDTFRTNRITTVRPNALAAHEVVALIEERTALLDRGCDHFTLLGLSIGAPIEDVHAAYVELSRHLRPGRLAELGIPDDGFTAQRLVAQLGIAFTVLTDRILRSEYVAALEAVDPARAATPR